jgi:hypothetical protein
MNRLSSRLTIGVKFLIPLSGIFCATFLSYIFIVVKHPPPLVFSIPFRVLIVVLASWPHIMVSKVYYSDDILMADNFLTQKKISFSQIDELTAYARFFYRIKYTDSDGSHRRQYFFPKATEVFMNFTDEPQSVIDFRDRLQLRKRGC